MINLEILEELLNEIMGVPKALTPWINSITQIIYDDASTLDEWDESGPVTYVDDEGEEVEDEALRMEERFISGKKVMMWRRMCAVAQTLNNF